MWRTIEYSDHNFSGWIWIQRTRTLSSGLGYFTTGSYTGISLNFIRLPRFQRREMEGNYEVADAEALISQRTLPVEPNINNSYIQSGEDIYRVIGVDDYSAYVHAQVYGLSLKKVENLD